jgi:hypothetical protein
LGIARLSYGKGYDCALFSKEQNIIGREREIVGGFGALRREQHQPLRTYRTSKCVKVGMAGDVNMIDIIHGGPTHPSIIPLEAHRLDQVHGRTHTGSEPQNSADVSGNLRSKRAIRILRDYLKAALA